jgi:hypothetical protein
LSDENLSFPLSLSVDERLCEENSRTLALTGEGDAFRRFFVFRSSRRYQGFDTGCRLSVRPMGSKGKEKLHKAGVTGLTIDLFILILTH